MLVLARARGEGIVVRVPPSAIETEILIMVTDLRFAQSREDSKARIGIQAPREVSINRDEVQAAIDSGEGYPA